MGSKLPTSLLYDFISLNLTVNFFSTKYTKHYAGCPTLPSHMRVHVRSMDELPCYTDGFTEEDDDMLRFENYSWDDDDEEPDRGVGSEAMLADTTVPVLGSEEATYVEDHEQPSCSNDSARRLFSNNKSERLTDDLSGVAPATTDATKPMKPVLVVEEATCVIDVEQPSCNNASIGWLFSNTLGSGVAPTTMDATKPTKPVLVSEEATCVLDIEDDEQASCSNNSAGWLFSNTLGSGVTPTTTDATKPVLVSKEATCVLDIEDDEQPSCSNNSPGWLFSNNTLERSSDDLFSVAPATTMEDKNAKIDRGTVEVIDLFTPSPVLRRKLKSSISAVSPEIIDLTQSPIYV